MVFLWYPCPWHVGLGRRPYGDSCMEIVDDGGSMGGGIELSFNNF